MPSMADINVYTDDGTTTAVIYNAVSPSAGDGSAAIWRPSSLGTSPAFRPKLEVTFRDNGDKSARKGYLFLNVPYTYTDSTTGLEMIRGNIPFRTEIAIPNTVPDATLRSAVNQWRNAMFSTLMLAILKARISAT